MNEIKITEKDLIGDIAGFPIEVVKKMVEEQVRQGNKANVNVFQERCKASKWAGGFDWEKTENGYYFWAMVFVCKEFDVFFEKYPKQETTEMQDAENATTQAHKEIDWEARRYEIAKSAMNGILASAAMYGGCHQSSFEVSNMAIYYADALIAELKKGGEQ